MNVYASKNDQPFSQYDYMIGFEIDEVKLRGYSNYYGNTLAYIGKKDPFVRNELQRITWQEISSTRFPSALVSAHFKQELDKGDFNKTNSHKFESNDLIYYLQDYEVNNWNQARILIVLDKTSKEKIYEALYLTDEGSSLAELEYQWTGKLLKNKPPVVFGFQWHSFSCPEIAFLNQEEKEIRIKCDCRH